MKAHLVIALSKTSRQIVFYPTWTENNLINRLKYRRFLHVRVENCSTNRFSRRYGMVYYDKNGIVIRDLQQSDAQIITEEEIAQGLDATIDKYEMRLKHQAEGKAIALVAEWNGGVAGYINVYPDAKSGAYANRGYAEIVDFGVLEKYRRRGIGSKLRQARIHSGRQRRMECILA